MIYIFLAIQLAIIFSALLVARWGINYLKRQAELQSSNVDSMMRFFEGLVKEHNEEVKRILDQSFKEREYLMERLQHPEYMVAQAPSAGENGEVSVVDEAREYETEEHSIVDDPYATRPIKPVKPFGYEEGQHAEE